MLESLILCARSVVVLSNISSFLMFIGKLFIVGVTGELFSINSYFPTQTELN